MDGYGDGGFSILFDFINGNNRKKSKIEMTAPVISEKIEMTAPVLSESGSISFVMPKQYSLETTPQPLDDRVKIVELPQRIVAALRFSGRWSNGKLREKTREMMQELAVAEIEPAGKIFSMRYNSPFTPWFLRRNEVAVAISYV